LSRLECRRTANPGVRNPPPSGGATRIQAGISGSPRRFPREIYVGRIGATTPDVLILSFNSSMVMRGGRSATLDNNTGSQRITTMAERAQSLQDTFLNHVRKNKTPLTIFLVNGVKLQGIVTWFDNFCVLLRRDGHSQLVYKHAISTIMPGQPIHLMEQEPAESQ
jgi:host factor-I protein